MTAKARDITIHRCDSPAIRSLMYRYHYSKKAAVNAQWNFAFILDGALIGGAQFGPPLDYSKVLPLVTGTTKNDMVELNRFVLIPDVPKNSASKTLGCCLRFLARRHYKWILSYANAMYSGPGTIYKATGFILCGIKRNDDPRHPTFYTLPDGRIVHVMSVKRTVRTHINTELREQLNMPEASGYEVLRQAGGIPYPGFIYRYIKFLDKTQQCNLSVKVLQYDQALHDPHIVQKDNIIPIPKNETVCQLRLF